MVAPETVAHREPFSILTLPDPIPDIGCAECPGRIAYFEDRDDVRKLVLRFGTLTEQALSQRKSAKLIADAASPEVATLVAPTA